MNLPQFLPELNVLALPAQCGTAVAAALHGQLIAALETPLPPTIDAGAVESLGQAVLQLLLAARSALPELTIEPVSPAFAERVERCGLGPALGLTTAGA